MTNGKINLTDFTILAFLMLFPISANAQKLRKKIAKPPSANQVYLNDSCFKKYNFSAQRRLKNYPFNLSNSIVAVSFDFLLDVGLIDESVEKSSGLPQMNSQLYKEKIIEYAVLDSSKINTQTDILYNYDYKEQTLINTVHSCFSPRNAIVFLDSSNKILSYIEICFECKEISISSNEIVTGNFCEGKYNILKDFFIGLGIRKGTIEK